MIFNVKKPNKCSRISDESWNALSLKEKDYIIFLHSKRFSKIQIMRLLHIEDRTSYWYLQKRVKEKLKIDVEKYNSIFLDACKNDKDA